MYSIIMSDEQIFQVTTVAVVTKAVLELTKLLEEIEKMEEKKRRTRRCWISPLFLTRGSGFFVNEVLGQLTNISVSGFSNTIASDFFQNFVRMRLEDFNALLNLVRPIIEKKILKCDRPYLQKSGWR